MNLLTNILFFVSAVSANILIDKNDPKIDFFAKVIVNLLRNQTVDKNVAFMRSAGWKSNEIIEKILLNLNSSMTVSFINNLEERKTGKYVNIILIDDLDDFE